MFAYQEKRTTLQLQNLKIWRGRKVHKKLKAAAPGTSTCCYIHSVCYIRIFNIGIIGILVQTILCCTKLLMHHRTFISHSNLHQLDASDITYCLLSLSLVSLLTCMTTKLSPDIVKYPLGDKITPNCKPLNYLYL